MKSMTGHGRGEASRSGYKVVVEISSVNRKQSEIFINLPRELDVLEAQARDEINRRVARGKVNCRILLSAKTQSVSAPVKINHPLARAYFKELKRLADSLQMEAPVSMDQLLRAPGVLEASEDFTDPETFWPALQKATRQALKALEAMRAREGNHLQKDLAHRVDRMKKAARRITARAPQVVAHYHQQLKKRVARSGVSLTPDDQERLLKEIVIFADRSDISEELARLQSHFKQYDHFAASKQPVGRTLDFLAQEMNREINTIGAKANDATIAREVVVLKTELEKFREQTQNVE